MGSMSESSECLPEFHNSHGNWIDSLTVEDILSEPMCAIAHCCGIQDAISLMRNLPGISVYIPIACKKKMNLQYIKNNFNGNNISAIAVKLEIDRSTVQRIVKKPISDITDDDIFYNGTLKLIVSECGRDVAVRLIQNSDKSICSRFYIPKNGFQFSMEKYINKNFSGSNAKKLALQLGVSERFIQKIISKIYAQKRTKKG